MARAIDYGTAVAQVRLLIADLGGDPTFTDEQLAGFLALNGATDSAATPAQVRRAAADALDAIATSEALVSKVIRTQDLTTDGAKLADALRKQAATLRAQADAEDADDEGGFLDAAEFHPYPAVGPELTGGWW